jgi:4-hydroxy-3-polyprenylbenzoate decarboxylase
MLVSKGVVDALDHSSPKFAVGGKLGLDCTGDEIKELGITLLEDNELLSKMQNISSDVKALKQYFLDTKNPITVISVEKSRNQKYLFEELKPLFEHIKILIIVDNAKNDVNNEYMLVWRVCNNIDSNRDLFIDGHTMCLDATDKNLHDNFKRRWPDDVDCTKEVIESLRQRKIIDISDEFINKFYL